MEIIVWGDSFAPLALVEDEGVKLTATKNLMPNQHRGVEYVVCLVDMYVHTDNCYGLNENETDHAHRRIKGPSHVMQSRLIYYNCGIKCSSLINALV